MTLPATTMPSKKDTSTVNEESPLLVGPDDREGGVQSCDGDGGTATTAKAAYHRFSPSHKMLIVCLSAISGSFPSAYICISSDIHPALTIDLCSVYVGLVHPAHTPDCERPSFDGRSRQVSAAYSAFSALVLLHRCSLAVSLSILSNSIGSLIWASYSAFCTSSSTCSREHTQSQPGLCRRKTTSAAALLDWDVHRLRLGGRSAGRARTPRRTDTASFRRVQRVVRRHRRSRRHLQNGRARQRVRCFLRRTHFAYHPSPLRSFLI